jgi:hypothetical protein
VTPTEVPMLDHAPPTGAAAPRDRDDEDSVIGGCNICGRPIDGPRLTDPERNRDVHPACLAQRLPQDAIVAPIAALALVLAPVIVVWAG